MAHREYAFESFQWIDGVEDYHTSKIEISYSSVTDTMYINGILLNLDDAHKLAAIFTEIANVRGQTLLENAEEFRILQRQDK